MQYLPLRLDGEKVSVYSHRLLKQMIEYVGLSHVKQKFISLSEVETLVSPFDSDPVCAHVDADMLSE